MKYSRSLCFSLAVVALFLAVFCVLWNKTAQGLLPIPSSLPPQGDIISRIEVYDRRNRPLSRTYINTWNYHHNLELWEIPILLKTAFITSEDKRYYRHHGVDWMARLSAIWTNLKNGKAVRGASTITEQVVRMIHPRNRSIWSRWLETFEAMELEKLFTKDQILTFYLNQVPYSSNRRGVLDAAHYYFGRDLSTLLPEEMLSLVALVRAPSAYNPYKEQASLQRPVRDLRARLKSNGFADLGDDTTPFKLKLSSMDDIVRAPEFVNFVRETAPLPPGRTRLVTTLDADLQAFALRALNRQLKRLADRRVTDGAVLLLNHRNDEILAWANGHSISSQTKQATMFQPDHSSIDAVLTPRQPGSTIKPFVYSLALEKGWTAATIIEDAPVEQAVNLGVHRYRNYSGMYYGPIRLREALGSSLNTPAIRTVQFIEPAHLLDCLKKLEFRSLHQSADYYGPGLALGNGEITLYELVSAYATLARQGVYHKPRITIDQPPSLEQKAIFSPDVASIISNILSDPMARRLEFGQGGVLELPYQVAVKTGTSNDYRDAWAVGYSSDYTVGVWMGNLSAEPMLEVNGSSGPGLVLRGIFAELFHRETPKPLPLSTTLLQRQICADSGAAADGSCPEIAEWFIPGTEPSPMMPPPITKVPSKPDLLKPINGLILAMDPRVPDSFEKYQFELANFAERGTGNSTSNIKEDIKVHWIIDDKEAAITTTSKYLWPLERGPHTVRAIIESTEKGVKPISTATRTFVVR